MINPTHLLNNLGAKLLQQKRRGLFGQRGYTLTEMLMVLLVFGILASIAFPSWLSFLDTVRLNNSQSELYQVLYTAKRQAQFQNITIQASFRDQKGYPEWAIHPVTLPPEQANWQRMDALVVIDSQETTLYQSKGIWRMQFNHKGNSNGQIGRITVTLRRGNQTRKRCIFVSTFIGTLREGKNNAKKKDGKYCY